MRFANLHDWLAWQEKLHPSEIDLGLDRVAQVLHRMTLTNSDFGIISIAGTNGKGSCVAMLDAIYRSAGYSVGAYTSPHLKKYNERIIINGVSVSDYQLCEVFEEIDQCRGEISLTYFEFGTLAAISLFAKASVDIAILEVGLGGRLDAVNVLDADLAIITSIGTDHKEWLGDSREKIALEKAGIARHHRPVVCGDLQPPESLIHFLEELDAPLYLINRDFFAQSTPLSENLAAPQSTWSWRDAQRSRHSLPVPALRGEMQLINAACVVQTLELLSSRWPVSQANIREGLSSAFIPARFQVIPGEVTVIIDVAHNVEAARVLAANLKTLTPHGATFAVFGCFRDKDLDGIVEVMLPVIDHWYVATLEGPRARDANAIAARITQHAGAGRATVCGSISLAKDSAIETAQKGDRVVMFGSFYVASEVL